MNRVQVDARGQSAASPATVYAVAKDSSGYPRWSRIGEFVNVRSGRDEPFGVGSVRIFRTWPLTIVEEVVDLVPDRRISYIVHRGLPFRDYKADIDLTPIAGGGTAIHWRSSFYPTIPGTGFLCRTFMHRVLTEMLPALAAEAERIEQPSRERAEGAERLESSQSA